MKPRARERMAGGPQESWFMEFLYVGMRRGKRLYALFPPSSSCCCCCGQPDGPSRSCIRGCVGSFCSPGQWCFAAVIKLFVSANLITVPSVMNQPTLFSCIRALSSQSQTSVEMDGLLPAHMCHLCFVHICNCFNHLCVRDNPHLKPKEDEISGYRVKMVTDNSSITWSMIHKENTLWEPSGSHQLSLQPTAERSMCGVWPHILG